MVQFNNFFLRKLALFVNIRSLDYHMSSAISVGSVRLQNVPHLLSVLPVLYGTDVMVLALHQPTCVASFL
jgi:hypothetical protein